MLRRFFIQLLILFFTFLPSVAAEIDSVTVRNIELPDSLTTLDRIFNERLQEGIEEANKDGKGACEEEDLYRELRKAMFQSFTASWGLKGYGLDKQLRELLAEKSYTLSLNDSIYRDINYLEGFSLNLKELSDVVTVNGHFIGLEKIGHFFAEGWSYFDTTHNDDKTFREALDWGKEQEEGKFGYVTTGIFSYGDLAANFNGWRFWNRIRMQQKDPLKSLMGNLFTTPYVKCKLQLFDSIKKRELYYAWEQTSRFTFKDYLDGSWDEANNCNSYADPIIEEKVDARIKEISPQFRCPASPRSCVEAQQKYDSYSRFLLHPLCLTATD